MKVQVPPTDYPAIQLTVEHPDGTIQQAVIVSGTAREYEFALPQGVDEKQCGVFAELCNARGKVDPITRQIVIQEPQLGSEPESVEPESVEPGPVEPEPVEPEPEHRVDPKPDPEESEEEHRVDPL